MRKIAFWISLAFLFTLPWEEIVNIEGFGAISRVLGFLLAACWGLSVLVTKKIRNPHPFHVIFTLFIMWHITSVFWTIDLNLTMRRIQAYIQLIPMLYIIWDLYTNPTDIKLGLQAYVLGAYVSIFSLISNFLAGAQFFYYRFSATGFDVNNIGVILALGIAPAWYLFNAENGNKLSWLFKVINLIYIPTAVLAILLTGSRGALLTTLFALIYVFLAPSQIRLSSRIVTIAIIVIALIVMQPLIPLETLQRIGTTEDQIVRGTLGGRYPIWVLGISAFVEKPIFGVGSSAFVAATELNKAAHNSLLSILVEVGLIGFSLFVILMGITTYKAFHHKKREALLWLAVLGILMIGIFSLNWAHRKQFWLFPTLVITSACSAKSDYKKTHSHDYQQIYKPIRMIDSTNRTFSNLEAEIRHHRGNFPGETQLNDT